VAYLDQGEGEPVLLLHGFPDIATTFQPVVQRLVEAGSRCVSPWLRGYAPTGMGRSTDRGALVADAVAVIEALDLAPMRIVGHDWGADVAYGLCATRPELVSSAVTMAVPHPRVFGMRFLLDPEQQRRSFYVFMFQLPGVAEAAIPNEDFAFVRWLWRQWSPGWGPPEDHLDEVIEALRKPGAVESALAYYRSFFDQAYQDPEFEDVRARLFDDISVPTLLLMGERDGCVAPGAAEGAESVFTGPYRFDLVPEAGHFLHLERPAEVARKIVEWFAEH
jgi:pimeloyl-ACP methyl ester carboxylesterase